MSRPLEKNRGPRRRALEWLARHPNYGPCWFCRKWRELFRGTCGPCWHEIETMEAVPSDILAEAMIRFHQAAIDGCEAIAIFFYALTRAEEEDE